MKKIIAAMAAVALFSVAISASARVCTNTATGKTYQCP
jgi:predicted small secreted protein